MRRLFPAARSSLSSTLAAVAAGGAAAAGPTPTPAAPPKPNGRRPSVSLVQPALARAEGSEAPGGLRGERAGQPLRVLVTGFHDWRDLGGTPNLWRCRDNPSCRLILGGPTTSPPVGRDGHLPRLLRDELPGVNFVFQTLSTTWGTSNSLDLLTYDLVVHLGLGVYDCHAKILVEDGAYNGRAGKDATGQEAGPALDMGAAQVCAHERMSRVVQGLSGRRVAGFEVEAARARQSNNYICNETHWRALKALQAAEQQGGCPLRACFFVHIPLPAKDAFKSPREEKAYVESLCDLADDTDYSHLARAVADLIKLLLAECTA